MALCLCSTVPVYLVPDLAHFDCTKAAATSGLWNTLIVFLRSVYYIEQDQFQQRQRSLVPNSTLYAGPALNSCLMLCFALRSVLPQQEVKEAFHKRSGKTTACVHRGGHPAVHSNS